ncbi:MAG: prolyl oligopeptidase family serine peptidase [Gammaproteobacteria bacterium]|nr:prolyl oligopeptidase family serine peptidase [Gammaproteobacteria bacterium]MCZ6855480.1 prolyl oligopeptidase family serine peptidase [Gammaproteobacteria bacterium]
MTKALPCGSWPSPITAEAIAAEATSYGELRAFDGSLFWLENRPSEQGRSTLLTFAGNGSIRELTPGDYFVRSRVHEYGGAAYLPTERGVFFVNFTDQNIYLVDVSSGVITQITSSDSNTRFCDFCWDDIRHQLITVCEQHLPDQEASNLLVSVDPESGDLTRLHTGRDFYASPRLSETCEQLAFLTWDHPNMPWDGTELVVAEVSATGALGEATVIAGGVAESILQPQWLVKGALLFLSDLNGFWNLYRYDSSGVYCILADGTEYAGPAWVFGLSSYAVLDDRHLVTQRLSREGSELVVVDTASGFASPLDSSWASYDFLTASDGRVHFIGGSTNAPASIVSYTLRNSTTQIVQQAGGLDVDPSWYSIAEAIEYPTRDGAIAHGYFYAPQSVEVEMPIDEQPPLVVMTHGGPTAMAARTLALKIQYFTSRGWAVLDVNYRGSSGYGRDYRDALLGFWGIRDVSDCEDGVRYLAGLGRIDPERVAIRGGSAGGYTTLAALTFGASHHTFRAGASYYGIGDLRALARDTHKFESRYLDGLLGSVEALDERSPIHHIDRLQCPVIFLQGGQDKVVPPNQAEAMVQALREKGIPVAYLNFPEEGHGFRSGPNIQRATEAEYGFFCRVFGIEAADELPDLEIINL